MAAATHLCIVGQKQAGGCGHAVVQPQGLQSPVPGLRQEVNSRLILCSCQAPSYKHMYKSAGLNIVTNARDRA